MKKINLLALFALWVVLFLGQSCQKKEEDVYVAKSVKVTLSYENGEIARPNVTITARTSGSGATFEQKTDAGGSATFKLPEGIYEFSASEVRTNNAKLTNYNGLVSRTISSDWQKSDVITLKMTASTKSQLIIKEIYFGGCPADDGGRAYSYGAYITVYNNSTQEVDMKNLCFGSLMFNSNSMKSDIKAGDTQPYWFKEDWTPATVGYFYFPNQTILKPGKQIVVAVSGGIDHSATYSQSVNLSSPENYVMYDIDVFTHKLSYPAPSAQIPASHHLKAVKYGLGTAWVVSTASPALFLFYPQGQDPKTYGQDRTNDDYWRNNTKFPRKKVPSTWVVDGIDVFRAGYESKNVKRLNPKIDAGYIYMVSKKGYTMYRNVDKAATESVEANKGKLVYNYNMGTKTIESKHGSTDPSGIDAEASLAKGALIIFKDTNNSGNDFHMRKKSSLRQ